MGITRFVAQGNTYTFPISPGDQDYHDNFKDVLNKTSKIPGADGGIDEHGTGRAPGPVGNIQFGIVMVSPQRSGMQLLRDAIGAMREWGVGRLYFQPTDLTLPERWAVCRVDNIGITEKRDQNTDLFQPVKLSFQATDPFWYRPGNQVLWDGTYTFNGAITWDDTAAGFTTITGSGTFSVTNPGNAFTHGRLVAKVTGATGFSSLIVRRLLNSAIVDEMVLQTPLVQNDVLEISPRAQWVLVNGVDKLSRFSFRHPDWLRLLPGVNSIQVILDDTAGEVSAAVRYFERYV